VYVGVGGQTRPLTGVAAGPDAKRVECAGEWSMARFAHLSLDELHAVHVRVGGDGAFVLGRGQLDSGDAGSVRLGEMDGVVASSRTDVQDAAAGDVTEDFCSRSDPFPRRPGELVGDGRGVGVSQLSAIHMPGPCVGVLGGHDCLLGGRAGDQVCVVR